MADNRTANEKKLDNINDRANWAAEKMVGEVREAILWTQFETAGDVKGTTSVGNELRWLPFNIRALQNTINAQTSQLISALAAVSKGEPFDEAKLLAGVKAASEAGVKAAIDNIEKTTTVTMKGDAK